MRNWISMIYESLLQLFVFFKIYICVSAVQSLSCVHLFCDSVDSSPPGSSVHGISQARILEWVAISFHRASSQPRDQTCISCVGWQVLYHWGTWEACISWACQYLSTSWDFVSAHCLFITQWYKHNVYIDSIMFSPWIFHHKHCPMWLKIPYKS